MVLNPDPNPITLGKSTAGGIAYTTMQGSPTFSVTQDASTAKEVIIIKKANFPAFVFESFPAPEDANQFIDLRRRMPALSGVAGLGTPYLTKTIEIVPKLSDLPLDDQEHVMLTISYETAQDKEGDEDDPETFLTHTLNVGGQLIAYASQHWEVDDGGILPDGGFGIPARQKKIQEPNMPMSVFIPTIEHTYSWARVQVPPFAAIREALGKVNADLFLGSPAEHLLFLGVSASQDFTMEGEEPWKIDFKFSERNKKNVGWNHFFHPATQTWRKLKNADGGFAYDESSSFGDLFRQGP